jgi:hypothetical protein
MHTSVTFNLTNVLGLFRNQILVCGDVTHDFVKVFIYFSNDGKGDTLMAEMLVSIEKWGELIEESLAYNAVVKQQINKNWFKIN